MSIITEEKNLSNYDQFDLREALFNEGATGPIEQIQVATERITKLRGILFDLDLKYFRTGALISNIDPDPEIFFANTVRSWLSHHPVLEKAEVRQSGGGLHVILRPDPVIEFADEREREEWAQIVKVLQAALPVDGEQPGLVANTRPIGSINGKNSIAVRQLREAQPLTEAEIRRLYDDMRLQPFLTVFQILTGVKSLQPCPVCGKQGSKLDATAWYGHCYENCGYVRLGQLYDLVLQSDDAGKEGKGDA